MPLLKIVQWFSTVSSVKFNPLSLARKVFHYLGATEPFSLASLHSPAPRSFHSAITADLHVEVLLAFDLLHPHLTRPLLIVL